ncbi:hypothetical protein J437_LFUL003605 [Ladona fulva]|uniref:PiggyBac transposable element-derived protein domain-containing protein n=1 Tax=Ladona fulva TaxID=123851 RepID=A0A8K0KHV9_LADFU|nr:hypothetical protein J437_LFUL003605 [Ladona fulva]
MKWHDKKVVSLLSMVHNTEFVDLEKRGKVSRKPKLVLEYNHTMGGVDRADQHLTNYPIIKKRGKKYYKKMFFHLLDQATWNSFVLYRKSGGTKSNLDFRMELVENIIERYHTEDMSSKGGRPSDEPHPLRLTERHFPGYIPATEKKEKPCRQCAVWLLLGNIFLALLHKKLLPDHLQLHNHLGKSPLLLGEDLLEQRHAAVSNAVRRRSFRALCASAIALLLGW